MTFTRGQLHGLLANLRRAGNPAAADAKARELDRPHRLAGEIALPPAPARQRSSGADLRGPWEGDGRGGRPARVIQGDH
jgi:hypothetical protein